MQLENFHTVSFNLQVIKMTIFLRIIKLQTEDVIQRHFHYSHLLHQAKNKSPEQRCILSQYWFIHKLSYQMNSEGFPFKKLLSSSSMCEGVWSQGVPFNSDGGALHEEGIDVAK